MIHCCLLTLPFTVAGSLKRYTKSAGNARLCLRSATLLSQGIHAEGNLRDPDIMNTIFKKRITATKIMFCYEYSYDNFMSVLVGKR
jgi:hypothetical protein